MTDSAPSPGNLLSKDDLTALLRDRSLIVSPLLDANAQIGNTGIDLRLDCFLREFIRTQQPFLSPAHPAHGSVIREIEPFRASTSFFLQPGEFALAQSLEYISLPANVICFLNGRSSLGRRGLVVHATANVVDPGWRGHLVFELANLGTMPIELVPLMRIARLVFLRIAPTAAYDGTYVGQIRITPPGPDRLVAAIKKLA